MVVDVLTSLQENIEKFHKAEGCQQEAQHLSSKKGGDYLETPTLSTLQTVLCTRNSFAKADACLKSSCEVSPFWLHRGQTSESVHGRGSRDEGSRREPATTDRYKGPTLELCFGNTG